MTETKINPGRSKGHSTPAKPVVLMTGATGFLGGAIGQALAANYTVVGLDRTPKDLAHAECVRCDFTADESVDEALREVTSRFGTRIVTVSAAAMGEPARPVRFINILLGVALMFAPFMFDGGSAVAHAAGVAAGLLLVALSIPRGRIDNAYGSWSRYLV